MKEYKNKLNHLHCCQVSLPPEVFLHTWSTGCQEVIQIHDTMNTRVQEWSKSTLSTTNKSYKEDCYPKAIPYLAQKIT